MRDLCSSDLSKKCSIRNHGANNSFCRQRSRGGGFSLKSVPRLSVYSGMRASRRRRLDRGVLRPFNQCQAIPPLSLFLSAVASHHHSACVNAVRVRDPDRPNRQHFSLVRPLHRETLCVRRVDSSLRSAHLPTALLFGIVRESLSSLYSPTLVAFQP